jgi:phosphoglycerate kinase
VKFVEDCIGKKAEEAASALKPGEILLLENLRFYSEEKKGDEEFAKKLSNLGDIYVNDAFGTAHRAHASTTIVAKYFEDKAMGLLLQKEIESLDKVLNSTEKPVTAVLGGAKVSSKITVIENILPKVDHLIIGGGMAFTFIKAQGGKIGESLVENDKLDVALHIMKMAEEKNVKVHLPVDSKTTQEFKNDSETKIQPINNIDDGWMGLDAGPKSQLAFAEIIKASKIILWNGPLGVFEMSNFASGTMEVCKAVAASDSISIIGGGDSVAAVNESGLADQMSHISTGGGASARDGSLCSSAQHRADRCGVVAQCAGLHH